MREKLNIPSGNKTILTLDGGGMRGILSIQLLKKIEQIAGMPCYEIFDMVAGTSTGAIIAALIATKHTAEQIDSLYENIVTLVFNRREFGSRYINLPEFNKNQYRAALQHVIGDIRLKDCCMDLLITSRDTAADEETFFSYFKNGDNNTYEDVLLRYVMEATMSAPTYFRPLERFLDGGTTAYNNPSQAALMEAIQFSGDKSYKQPITLFNIGTGISRQFVPNPNFDLPQVINWLITAASQDASSMQNDFFRSGCVQNVDFRGFQISLDSRSIYQLPTVEYEPGKYLHEAEVNNIDMADLSKFELVKAIGQQFAVYLGDQGFNKDLKDKLVTSAGDVNVIKNNLSNITWLNNIKS